MNSYRTYYLLVALALAYADTFSQFSDVNLTPGAGDHSETCIAVDPLNLVRQVVVWNDFELSHTDNTAYSQAGFSITTNGGSTWSSRYVLSPTTESGQLWKWGVDPSVAIDRNGNIFYSYLATLSSDIADGSAAYIAKSTDNGANWALKRVSSQITYQDRPDLPPFYVPT